MQGSNPLAKCNVCIGTAAVAVGKLPVVCTHEGYIGVSKESALMELLVLGTISALELLVLDTVVHLYRAVLDLLLRLLSLLRLLLGILRTKDRPSCQECHCHKGCHICFLQAHVLLIGKFIQFIIIVQVPFLVRHISRMEGGFVNKGLLLLLGKTGICSGILIGFQGLV